MNASRLDAAYLTFPAGPADAADLAHVHVTAWRETYRGLLADGYLARLSQPAHARRFARDLDLGGASGVLLAAADPGGLVGYVQGGPSRRRVTGEAEVQTLYVLQAAQGRGVGRRLLTDAARALAAQGATSLVISVLSGNAPARWFYEHMGGVAEAERSEPGPDGRPTLEVAYDWADIARLIG